MTRRPARRGAVLLTAAAVEPYELMKLRLLNSTHSALSYVALLLGHERVDAAMADADVRAFARARGSSRRACRCPLSRVSTSNEYARDACCAASRTRT